jgi:hypothetical protein
MVTAAFAGPSLCPDFAYDFHSFTVLARGAPGAGGSVKNSRLTVKIVRVTAHNVSIAVLTAESLSLIISLLN